MVVYTLFFTEPQGPYHLLKMHKTPVYLAPLQRASSFMLHTVVNLWRMQKEACSRSFLTAVHSSTLEVFLAESVM